MESYGARHADAVAVKGGVWIALASPVSLSPPPVRYAALLCLVLPHADGFVRVHEIMGADNAEADNIPLYVIVCLLRQSAIAVTLTRLTHHVLVWLVRVTAWSPAVVFTATSTLIHEVIYWGFYLFSRLDARYGLARCYRIDAIPARQLHHSQGDPARIAQWHAERETPESLVSWAATCALVNHLVLQPMTLYWCHVWFAGDRATFLPDAPVTYTTSEKFLGFILVLVANEVATYGVHRLFHSAAFFPWLHKHHHNFVKVDILGSEHAHVLEHLLGTQLSIATVCASTSADMASWLVFVSMKCWETCELHSGYDFRGTMLGRLGLFNGFRCVYHHWHHAGHIHSNFGSFMFLDYWLGTMRSFLDDVKEKRRMRSAVTKLGCACVEQ